MREDLPPDLAERFHEHAVDPRLQDLVAHVARRRSVTGGEPNGGYVSVRPSALGTICAYVHRDYVDVALSPDQATRLERDRGLRILKSNSETAFVQVRLQHLNDAEGLEQARQIMLQAVDKSEAGTAYEGGNAGPRRPSAKAATCPIHHVAMYGGHCDLCE